MLGNILTISDVMKRYQLKSKTTAYEVMYAIGVMKIGQKLYVKEADVERYENKMKGDSR